MNLSDLMKRIRIDSEAELIQKQIPTKLSIDYH